MTEAALHKLIIETMGAIRTDVHSVRMEVQGLRVEIDTVREDGSKRGRDLWDQTKKQGELLIRVEERMKRVEEQIAESKPTLSDYRTWKTRVEAAGWMGRRLWILGGALITFAIWLYSSWDKIIHWLRIIMGFKG